MTKYNILLHNLPISCFGIFLTVLMILGQAEITQAGDWTMLGHDAAHTSATDEVVTPPLDYLWGFKTGFDDSSHTSAAISRGILYIGFSNIVYALDATNGVLKWKYMTGGNVNDPAVYGEMVYITFDNTVLALDATTGTFKWKYTADGEVTSPTISNGVIYVSSDDSNVTALYASTGNLKWKSKVGTDPTGDPYWDKIGEGIPSPPSVSLGIVYVKGFKDCKIYALDAETGALKWKNTNQSNSGPSPMIYNGIVYTLSNINVFAYDAATGVLKWKYKSEIDFTYRFFGSAAISDNVVYVGSWIDREGGSVYGLEAIDTTTGALKWKYETRNPVMEHFAVSDGVVYISNPRLFALDAATGNLQWKFDKKYAPGDTVVVSGGIVYVSSSYGYITAFTSMPKLLKETISGSLDVIKTINRNELLIYSFSGRERKINVSIDVINGGPIDIYLTSETNCNGFPDFSINPYFREGSGTNIKSKSYVFHSKNIYSKDPNDTYCIVIDNTYKYGVSPSGPVDVKIRITPEEIPQPKLTLTKSLTPSTITEGDAATVTVRVENTGGGAKSVVITDTIPQGFILMRGNVSQEYTSLKANESRTFQYTIRATGTGSFSTEPATVTYQDEKGASYLVTSNYATITVQAEAAEQVPQQQVTQSPQPKTPGFGTILAGIGMILALVFRKR